MPIPNIAGLLSDLKRKNTESIAYRHDLDRRGLQRFIGSVPWDHRPLLEELARQIGSQLGEDDGVIVFDPSGHKKCGNDSVGWYHHQTLSLIATWFLILETLRGGKIYASADSSTGSYFAVHTHAFAAPIENMGIDHRGFDIFVAQELLHGSNVVAIVPSSISTHFKSWVTPGNS